MFDKRFFRIKLSSGFLLLEMLIIISIIAVITGLGIVNFVNSKENAKISEAIFIQNEIRVAVEAYYQDMKFYPPDVNRGWDPGFEKPDPWNPDGQTISGINDDHLPDNWQDLVAVRWKGPYLKSWPRLTPWGGKYDYNYWGSGQTRREGCSVRPGIYIGIQGNYDDSFTISDFAEKRMVTDRVDNDNCLNNEAQLLIELLN